MYPITSTQRLQVEHTLQQCWVRHGHNSTVVTLYETDKYQGHIVKPVGTCQQHVGLINCHGGGEQDKQTHRNRGCSVTEIWTNKGLPGRLMILSTRKNDSCSWGVLPPVSSLNHVCTCNMAYPALIYSLKLGAPNSCSWGVLPPTTI